MQSPAQGVAKSQRMLVYASFVRHSVLGQSLFLLAWAIFGSSEVLAAPHANVVNVSADPKVAAGGGRLLIFVTRKNDSRERLPEQVDIDLMHPTTATVVLGQDVASLRHGYSVALGNAQAAPIAFSDLAAGDYWVQAVLDSNRDYARYGRGAGDVVSAVESIHIPLESPVSVRLIRRIPKEDPWNPPNASPARRVQLSRARARIIDFKVASPSLSAFSKHAVSIKAWVLLPPGYSTEPSHVWPTVYILGTYSSHHLDRNDIGLLALLAQLSDEGSLPPFLWVFPDYAVDTGVTEFIDTVNDGPWGRALTGDLMPALERRFNMDPRRAARFLWGHSSGGWASIWLQLHHSDLFGGAWATAPDSTDFHDFVGANLYSENANLYYDESNELRPIVREHGSATATLKDWVHIEDVLGTDGGVFRSYDWIFSPKGKGGRPQFMFNHETGEINSTVAAYWGDHFDASRFIANLSPQIKNSLQGTLHVYVGTEDTHYLDGSVKWLKNAMEQAGLDGQVVFVPKRNHNDLYMKGNDQLGLLKVFATQMTEVAQTGPDSSHQIH